MTWGFALVGGRLLSRADGPGALLMYEDAEGKRLVLYACRDEAKGRDTAFRFAQQEGISMFHWADAPLTYARAAELPALTCMPWRKRSTSKPPSDPGSDWTPAAGIGPSATRETEPTQDHRTPEQKGPGGCRGQ
jgi:hypothetical protein